MNPISNLTLHEDRVHLFTVNTADGTFWVYHKVQRKSREISPHILRTWLRLNQEYAHKFESEHYAFEISGTMLEFVPWE